MVKKQAEESWDTFSLSMNSSSSIRKYLDYCKEWYLFHDNEVSVATQFCNIAPKLDHKSINRLGLHDTELRNINSFICYMCKEEHDEINKKTLMANPFTRAQYVLVCVNCNHNIHANR